MILDGWKLKRIIRERGQTQQDIADAAGLTRATVTLALNGKGCHTSTAQKIADVLGLTLADVAQQEEEREGGAIDQGKYTG